MCMCEHIRMRDGGERWAKIHDPCSSRLAMAQHNGHPIVGNSVVLGAGGPGRLSDGIFVFHHAG